MRPLAVALFVLVSSSIVRAEEIKLAAVHLKLTMPQTGWGVWDAPDAQTASTGFKFTLVKQGKGTVFALKAFPPEDGPSNRTLSKEEHLHALELSKIDFSHGALEREEEMVQFLGCRCYRARCHPSKAFAGATGRGTVFVFYSHDLWYVITMWTNEGGLFWADENEVLKPILESIQFLPEEPESNKRGTDNDGAAPHRV